MVSVILLLPSDPLRPRRPDEHFAPEADAARGLDVPLALVDHDALTRSGCADEAVIRVPEGEDAVYRGWMLRSEQYQAFAEALSRRGTRLRTSASAYRRAHELPGWYDYLVSVTPTSAWTTLRVREEFDACRATLSSGPIVLRDYTKSLKHHWDEACFIPDVANAEAAWRLAERFLELRGEDLVGGLVLRRFETFIGAEVRTWWVNGACALVTAHPDTSQNLPPSDVEIAPLTSLVARLGLPFVTVDLARREDGAWRVVELGDGQVSDRPATTPAVELVSALLA